MKKINIRINDIKKKQAGFTLVELMISLTIIIIVTAIAIPNFQKAGEKAQASGCDGNKKIILAQMENYFMVNNKYPLLASVDGENGIIRFYENFDIDEKSVGDTPLHKAYADLDNKVDWHAVDLLEMKEEGYLQEIATCTRGGFYLVKLDNNKVSEIMCSVMDVQNE